MAFAEDLLEQAHHLARRERTKPKQASLRRAISTAYYALFHLLVRETVGHWKLVDQRTSLARTLEHGKMKTASVRVASASFSSSPADTVTNLKRVASAFIKLQQLRHGADYDNSRKWSRTEALAQVNLASKAFESWRAVRNETIAHDYLLSLLVTR